jgi:hypothetical protein
MVRLCGAVAVPVAATNDHGSRCACRVLEAAEMLLQAQGWTLVLIRLMLDV